MPKKSFLTEGVDPKLLNRTHPKPAQLQDGRWCRDRLPWGGITEPNNCDCVGTCAYDNPGLDSET